MTQDRHRWRKNLWSTAPQPKDDDEELQSKNFKGWQATRSLLVLNLKNPSTFCSNKNISLTNAILSITILPTRVILGIRRGRYTHGGRRAEGIFEVNLACIDLLYTATHWTVTFVVQWHAHSPEVSVNIRTAKVVVLYLFTVTCIEIWCVRSLGRIKSSRLRLFFDDVPEKMACSGLLLSERLEQATEKKGMDLWKQMSSKWSFTFFCGIFWLKPVPFRDYSLCSVCILH